MYYSFKDFSPLPGWIKTAMLSSNTIQPDNWINKFPDSYAARQVTQKDGSVTVTQTFKRYGLDQTVWDWVRKNTYPDIIDCCVCVGEVTNQSCGPHRDRNRNFTLLWIVDTGGNNVETCFWQEQGQPIVRSITKEQYHQQPSDYRVLNKLDSVVIPPNRWILLDARVLHSIENITGNRVSFQISLDTVPDNL